MMSNQDHDRLGYDFQPMSRNPLPDFSQQGYQVERELGHNRSGGRVTYLAIATSTQLPVVIKQFQFARTGASWQDYEAHEQEIKLLQQLNHPSIPQYLDSFETSDGFCLVQEYKDAPALSQPRSFTVEQVKQIAGAVLEVLVYLQQQVPPVIHRDIKPENLLVDQQLKVYLVDFGLARLGGEAVAASSVVKGTPGFMPPEQLFNRQLTTASDLYSLGATLICLLTQTPSTEIGQLIDESYQINFRSLLPQLSPQLMNWLEKMVAPNLKHRYTNAAAALAALQAIAPSSSLTSVSRLQPLATGALLLSLGVGTVLGSIILSYRTVGPSRIEPPLVALQQLQQTRQCQGCDLRGADLRGADLRSVDLTGADLREADLEGADLRGAYLAIANLTNANLRHTNLASTDLRGATLPDGSVYSGPKPFVADFSNP